MNVESRNNNVKEWVVFMGIDNKSDKNKNNTERKQDSLKRQSLIRERIKKIMKEKNLRQKDLVEKTGISQVFLSYFLNGKYNIGVDSLCKIAKALDVSVDFLTRKEQKEIPSVKDIGKEVEFIPIVAAVKAGSPDSPVEYQYKEKFFPYKESLHCDECYIIEVNGDSMSPTLEKGDCILVKPIEKYPMLIPENFDGKIVVAANENWEYIIKRLKKVGDEWVLVSDNPNYDIVKTNGWHVVGVAIERLPKPEKL